jgi:WS/DGAT/MGAT family acyltransferase
MGTSAPTDGGVLTGRSSPAAVAIRKRLSPLDAAFLYFEKPQQRMHVGCLALLDGPIPFDGFVRAMEERLGRIERYRERPVRPLLDLDWPRWEVEPGFEIRRHLRHVAVPPPGGEAELHELVDSLFATRIDPRHPLWETYLVDGLAGGRSAVLCKIHHSMVDGVSGAQLLEAMADPATHPRRLRVRMRRPPPRSSRGSGRRPSSAPRATRCRRSASSARSCSSRSPPCPSTARSRTRVGCCGRPSSSTPSSRCGASRDAR